MRIFGNDGMETLFTTIDILNSTWHDKMFNAWANSINQQ